MMSMEAVFPAIGGMGMRLIGTVVMFAATAGRTVRGGVGPTGRLACAGAVSTVCVVHGVGLGTGVTVAGTVAGADDVVAAGVFAHAEMKRVAKTSARAGRIDRSISASPVVGASLVLPSTVVLRGERPET